MTLIRRVRLLLLSVLTLAVLGAAAVNLWTARETLQAQVRLKNADAAQMLALLITQLKPDAATLLLLLRAQADTGHYRMIRFVPQGDGAAVEQRFDVEPGPAPAWFRRVLPIGSPAAAAEVADGWRVIGRIEVDTHVEHAYTTLWQGGLQSLWWLLLLAAAGVVVATIGVRRLQRPLDDTVGQANALAEGRYLRVNEPDVPELRRVTTAMNLMVERVQHQFGQLAAEAEHWRRTAHTDPLTGLPHRVHFLTTLGNALQNEDGVARGALMLLRVADLAQANREQGRGGVDDGLRALAGVLQDFQARMSGSSCGRLNGSDFALFVPLSGAAAPLAAQLAAALQAQVPQLDCAVGVTVAAHGSAVHEVLARADAALAQAEFDDGHAPALGDHAEPALGELAWRDRLLAALAQGRAHLAEYPVRRADGSVLHTECPLRLQIDDGVDAEAMVAARWLPLAVRAGLHTDLDLEAVRLAVAASAADGRARCVNVAAATLADPGFLPRLREHLAAVPLGARLLWLDLPEAAASAQPRLVQELARQLREWGVQVGLEHAGTRLATASRLFELGLAYVKLDAAHCTGLAGQEAAQAFLRRTVQMLSGVGVRAIAEGVRSDEDARLLHDCGIQALTGPWASRPD